MKTYALQRRLAAKLLKVGQNRVWLDPSRLKDIGNAITKLDIAQLISEGAIKKLPCIGIKRRAGKIRQLRKRKRKARRKKKMERKKSFYMARIRKLRAYLAMLRRKNLIDSTRYRILRLAAKAGTIKTIKEIKAKFEK